MPQLQQRDNQQYSSSMTGGSTSSGSANYNGATLPRFQTHILPNPFSNGTKDHQSRTSHTPNSSNAYDGQRQRHTPNSSNAYDGQRQRTSPVTVNPKPYTPLPVVRPKSRNGGSTSPNSMPIMAHPQPVHVALSVESDTALLSATRSNKIETLRMHRLLSNQTSGASTISVSLAVGLLLPSDQSSL